MYINFLIYVNFMSNAIALILCQMLWHLAIAGCFTTQLLHCNQLLNLDVLLAGRSNLSITWVPLFIACCLPGGSVPLNEFLQTPVLISRDFMLCESVSAYFSLTL